MDGVAQRALENLRSRVQESGAEVRLEALPEVVGDEGQLVQRCTNLLGNALKFHGTVPPRVAFRTEADG